MTRNRLLAVTAGIFLAPIALAIAFVAIFGWNWLRAPIERIALDKTGRKLEIAGDLHIRLAWPLPQVDARKVSFANPDWATEKSMVSAESVLVTVDLPQLLRRNLVLPEVRLERPVIFLEQDSGGRKNWLLDPEQKDESARIRIERLMLDHGTLGYDDAAQKTRIRSELSTADADAKSNAAAVSFNATGQFRGLALTARGTGGPVLGLRDESTPYPVKVDIAVGKTALKAEGTITSLLKFTSMDMKLDLRGDSLAQLYPLIGIAFPATRPYATRGHIVHAADKWRYEKFSGHFGESDIAGTLEVVTGGVRPVLAGELGSRILDIADLGPLVGSRPGSVKAARAKAGATKFRDAASATSTAHVLPDIPFSTGSWNSVDADVMLTAKTIRRAKDLPLDDLKVHLKLKDSVLTLDPLDFGIAGGHLASVITLDGRSGPIHAKAKVLARKILISRLFPAVDLNRNSVGQINGQFDLAGTGNSVGRMLASSRGTAGLVIAGGEVSRLMMEKAGLHLWEILELSMTGDKLIKLRCAAADFRVDAGIMHANALVFDSEVTTINGTGTIDLGRETLDLTLNQKTKNTSPLALRSPIHVRGSFALPVVEVDKGQMAVRAIGALALGLINPFLALIPLIDAGPGRDSDCGVLLQGTPGHRADKPASGQAVPEAKKSPRSSL